MKAKGRQYGVTLVEMTVVVAIVALLVSLGLPAIRALLNSFESQEGAHTLISSSLASARALAAKEQRYAGIRFQHKDPNCRGAQYMIFIVHDPDPEPNGTDLANGFRAVEGTQPIKLTESVGVADLVVVQRTLKANKQIDFTDNPINSNDEINSIEELRDTTTFSVIFSPSGKLVIHEVRIRNKNGQTNSTSDDDIFNTNIKVENGLAMFYQDDDIGMGLGPELSRNCFIVYDRNLFNSVDVGRRYSDCLSKSETVYINPYTGTIIKR